MVRTVAVSVAAILCCASIAVAADDPKTLLIGKWSLSESEGRTTYEYTKDGAFILRTGPVGGKGSYKWLDAQTIELKVAGSITRQQINVTQDDLTITNDAKVVLKLKRLKE